MKNENNREENQASGQNIEFIRYDPWMDNQDVMKRLHVSQRTLQTWRNKKLLPYYKIRGKIYYRESELTRMIEKGRV